MLAHKNNRSESNCVNKSTLNFKDLSIFSNNSLSENNTNNISNPENCAVITAEKAVSKPVVSSLDSEYEKFMEAVWPQIGDDGNNSYIDHSAAQDITLENSNNSKTSSFDLSNSEDLYENKEIMHKPKASEQMFVEDEKLQYFNIDKPEINDAKKTDTSFVPCPDISKSSDVNTTYLKTGEECWNSENSSDDRKSGKYSPNYSGYFLFIFI